jgi:hypothetical protein
LLLWLLLLLLLQLVGMDLALAHLLLSTFLIQVAAEEGKGARLVSHIGGRHCKVLYVFAVSIILQRCWYAWNRVRK